MIQATIGNTVVPTIQVIVSADETGNIAFYQDGHALGAFSIAEPDTLLGVLRNGGADVTDLRAADKLAGLVI